MVRNYQRKTNKASYPKEQLHDAVRAVRNGLSGYKAARIFKIPRSTIMDHVKNKRLKSHTLGRSTCLPQEEENKLASYIHIMERNGFGLTRDEILDIVGDYVNQNKIKTSFKNGRPGKDWFVSFKSRNKLSVKKPQAVEYCRKQAVDPFIIFPYFELLEKKIRELGLTHKPSSIWNLDETSFSKDPSKTKIVGRRGHAATRIVSSSGKDNTTVLLAANAIGDKVPPLIIFKGKNVWDKWTSPEAYPNTTYAATSNGWMEAEVFENYFKKSFIPALGKERPVLLLYDGHSTHVGLRILEQAVKENITIIKLPAHTSHLLQPLDLKVMKVFKDRWDTLLVKWQRRNYAVPLPKNGIVWAEMDSTIISNGFKKAGIYPYDVEVVKESQFNSLQLARWKQQFATCGSLENIKTTPASDVHNLQSFRSKETGSLLSIVLELINNKISSDLRNNNVEVKRHDNCDCATQTKANIAEICTATFEQLLLNKVKRGDNTKITRKKIASGAEVITHTDVIERKRLENRKKRRPVTILGENSRNTNSQSMSLTAKKSSGNDKSISLHDKKERKKEFQPPITSSSTVTYLDDISRNDTQRKSFCVEKPEDVPLCLRKTIPEERRIKVLSNILIKAPSEPYTPSEKVFVDPGPSGIITKVNKVKNIRKKGCGKENGIPNKKAIIKKVQRIRKKHRLPSPTSSTTSVSGFLSVHSDSDNTTCIDDNDGDEELNSSYLQETKGMHILNEITEMSSISWQPPDPFYSINDHVLVGYYKTKWTYYVGIIEGIKQKEEPYYSIKFYKTMKKPNLVFKTTRLVDRDDVMKF